MAAFQSYNSGPMRALGLKGRLVWVLLHEGALQLQGEESGVVRVTPTDIERMRIGYSDGRWRAYETLIWRGGDAKPLRLMPSTPMWTAYAETIRAFAGMMAAEGRLERIEGGSSKFDALFAPVLLGLLAVGTVLLAIFVLEGEPWWGRLLSPVVFTSLFGLFLWIALRRQWPRPLTDLAELEGQLPPTVNRSSSLRDKLWPLVGGRRRK